jgi:hypothetical protein
MRPAKLGLAVLALAAVVALFKIPEGLAEENYEGWAILQNPFESTGGGGVMIGEYNPVIVGSRCVTNFTATLPDGKVYNNVVEFETVQVQGARSAPTAPGAPATAAPRAPRRSVCSSRTA